MTKNSSIHPFHFHLFFHFFFTEELAATSIHKKRENRNHNMKTIFLWCREGPSSSAMIRCNLQKTLQLLVCAVFVDLFSRSPSETSSSSLREENHNYFRNGGFLVVSLSFSRPFCACRAHLYFISILKKWKNVFISFYVRNFAHCCTFFCVRHKVANNILYAQSPRKESKFEFHKISSAVGLKQQPNSEQQQRNNVIKTREHFHAP